MRAYLRDIPAAMLTLILCRSMSLAQSTPSSVVVLTNAAQIRNLAPGRAAAAIPTRLRGVMIDESAPHGDAVILADETAGIYVRAATNLFLPFQRGDLLEVTGVTDPGQFAPIVKVSAVEKVGTAPIPAPRPVSYQELITGALDGQWVEISGVVRRRLVPAPDIWRVYIAANGGVFSVRGSAPLDPGMQEDAEVRFQAICLYQFNQKRQVMAPVLQVPRGVPVQVIKPAPADLFAAPLRAADSLLQFAPDHPTGHRIHVHGTVTHAEAGSLVWIRDGESGLRLQARQQEPLKPGDEIEALGFPVYGSFSPMLEDALFRKTGSGPAPAPVKLSEVTNAFEFGDDLISTEAFITDVQPVFEGVALTLKSSGMEFKALWKSPGELRENLNWKSGSKVRIAGICSIVSDDALPLMGIWQPRSFQILIRSPADVVVLKWPSWWTPQHVIFLLGSIISGLLLITGAVMLAVRRRLLDQERQRAMAEAEFGAILSERNRMAREIHDTLSQGLVATAIQLRLAKKQSLGAPESLRQHLNSALQLVHQSLQEARNSIWNMRSQVLENGDLADALGNILKQMADATETETTIEVDGKPRRLAPMIESNLLRVGQEAITNAAKHAQAKHIWVSLDFAEKHFRLTVKDDGRGFDSTKPRPSSDGFGLVGMRERVAELQGDLKILSAPGVGSEIQLTIPLSDK